MNGGARIERAIRSASPALVAFLTGGFPDRERFAALLPRMREAADLVEVGVPFSDPMADGVTIQRSSRAALERGANLDTILRAVADSGGRAPVLLMSYLNPLLAAGFEALARRAAEAGVSGFIVPDLPLEESQPLREALAGAGLGLVQLVTPVTPPPRLERLCRASDGFVYAVTVTGTTGGTAARDPASWHRLNSYLDRVRAVSPRPVCAGFGIRTPEHAAALGAHADGLIVGSALIEEIEAGRDPVRFVEDLRAALDRPRRPER
ncbi:MAG: tryptophan synthase subunit alpha [Acidobacteria bacterium]|nr:MAG: tryptophan synthase subunit alpha [Acidobacteriota bacterium]